MTVINGHRCDTDTQLLYPTVQPLVNIVTGLTSRVIDMNCLQVLQADKLLEIMHHFIVTRLCTNIITYTTPDRCIHKLPSNMPDTLHPLTRDKLMAAYTS